MSAVVAADVHVRVEEQPRAQLDNHERRDTQKYE
jgi:hypothetical protein